MGQPTVGDVFLSIFPYSDLTNQKKRPVVVIGLAEFGDVIICQITSKPYSSKLARKITPADFTAGSLPVVSFVRPDKLFTVSPTLLADYIGQLTPEVTVDVLAAVRLLFSAE